jgi:hypothetical protein
VLIIIATAGAIVAAVLMLFSFLVVRRSTSDPWLEGADYTTLTNCLGTEGMDRQMLGTGTLAVFPDEIRFLIATPRRQLVIPRRKLSVTLEQFPDAGDYRPGDDPALVIRWTQDKQRRAIGFRVMEAEDLRDLLLS